jgi:LPS sulfotransferase NodH
MSGNGTSGGTGKQQKLICVTGSQRSGSTAFRTTLADTGRFADFGEIFDQGDRPESYIQFCRTQNVSPMIANSEVNIVRFTADYLNYLRQLAGTSHVLFDVKFDSWTQITLPWSHLHQEPFLLTRLKREQASIVLIWRDNLVDQILSYFVAVASGKWHNVKAGDIEQQFSIDVAEIRQRALLVCQSEKFFLDALLNHRGFLPLCYEDIFGDNGRFSDFARQVAKTINGSPLEFARSGRIAKNSVRPQDVVTNYAVLAEAIDEVADLYRKDFLGVVRPRRPPVPAASVASAPGG